MLAVSLVLGTTIIVARYTGVFRLKSIAIEPQSLMAKCPSIKQSMGQNLFGAALDKVADDLLNYGNVLRVDIDFDFPDALSIRVNDIRPLALVLDGDGRYVYRMDERGCLLPGDSTIERYEFPIITGLQRCKLYSRPADDRMHLVVEQLNRLKKDCFNFYLAISNIDMSDQDIISIYLDGLAFPVETYAGSLYGSIINLKTFLLDFNPDLSGIKRLDMKSEGLIIAAGGKCQKTGY